MKRLKYIFEEKKLFVSAVVLLGAMTAAGAFVLPSLNAAAPVETTVAENQEITQLRYIVGVLKESRTGLSPRDEIMLAKVIIDESEAHGVDPLLVLAVIKTESTFYNWARSHKGAMGLMQIMPRTGRWVAERNDLEWRGERTLFDPHLNVRLGIRYLTILMERYGDDTMLTLAAYNEGPTRLSARMRSGGDPPRRYANKVLTNYKDFQEDAKMMSFYAG